MSSSSPAEKTADLQQENIEEKEISIGDQFLALINDTAAIDALFQTAAKQAGMASVHTLEISPLEDIRIGDISTTVNIATPLALSFSIPESMAMFYDCVTRIRNATGDITRDTVTLEMLGNIVHQLHQFPVHEARDRARPEQEVDILERSWPIRTAVGRFFSSSLPGVPLWEYVIRLQRHLRLSGYVFMVAILLLYRMTKAPSRAVLESLFRLESDSRGSDEGEANEDGKEDEGEDEDEDEVSSGSIQNPAFEYIHLITARSEHRLTLTVLRVASKIVEDVVVNNTGCAGVSGVSTRGLVRLERTLCVLLDFELGYLGAAVARETVNMRCLVGVMEGQSKLKTEGESEKEKGSGKDEKEMKMVDSPQAVCLEITDPVGGPD